MTTLFPWSFDASCMNLYCVYVKKKNDITTCGRLPARLMISQTAAGVAGIMDRWSRHSLPMLTMWKPSTSFSGAMALHTARSSMWATAKGREGEGGSRPQLSAESDACNRCCAWSCAEQSSSQPANPPMSTKSVDGRLPSECSNKWRPPTFHYLLYLEVQ